LGRALSNASRSLEILSAAFLVGAEGFFSDFWPTKQLNSNVIPWENLQKLALTSHLLSLHVKRRKISNLMMAAGRAAAFMPRLEIMEIWNGGEGHASVFRYDNVTGQPQIIWASNWGGYKQWDYDVVFCWANLPQHRRHPHANLTTAIERLPTRQRDTKTHATAIDYLKLRRFILAPISHYQLAWGKYNSPKVVASTVAT